MEFLLIHGGWIVARYLPTLCVSQLLLLTMGLSRSSSSYILVGIRGSMLWFTRVESVVEVHTLHFLFSAAVVLLLCCLVCLVSPQV